MRRKIFVQCINICAVHKFVHIIYKKSQVATTHDACPAVRRIYIYIYIVDNIITRFAGVRSKFDGRDGKFSTSLN